MITMKRYLFTIITLLFVLCLSSCSKESAIYYVKYEVQISSVYAAADCAYTVTTENGTQTINTRAKSWSETFGPVKKGFEASINARTDFKGYITINIYVCRGEEPFTIKAQYASPNYTNSVSGFTSYTIDY